MKVFPSILLTAVLAWTSAAPAAVEIIAHRGASFDAPENTLSALKLGWEQHTDVGELDIHLTRDGKIVLMHDGTAKRTTGADLEIAAANYDDLRALDAGSFKGARWTGEKIPSLAEALATMPGGKRMFIEIKCGPEVLPELERVLQESGKKIEQLVLIGFNYGTMQQARERFPKAPIYWLASFKKDKEGRTPSIEDLIEKTKAARFDGLNLDFKFPIDAAFVGKVKGAGLKLYTWTVDDAAVAKRLAAAGVDGITTNRPEWLRQQLRP